VKTHYGTFNRDGEQVEFELKTLGEEKNPYAYFLREADYNEEGHITKEDAEAVARKFGWDFQDRGEIHNAMFYVYDSTDKKVWDEYVFGVDNEKKMFFHNTNSPRAQYELEKDYREVQLTRTKTELLEQGEHDKAFMDSKKLDEKSNERLKDAFVLEGEERTAALKDAHYMQQRQRQFESFKEEFEDIKQQEENKMHH
jgi:hypothetical protein